MKTTTWLHQVQAVVKQAIEDGGNVLLVPAFTGGCHVLRYDLREDAVLHATGQHPRKHAILRPRWAGKEIKSLRVYGKSFGFDGRRGKFLALAVLVDKESSFNQKRNQLLEMNCLQQAGFYTALPLSRVFDPEALASSLAIVEHYRAVVEATNQNESLYHNKLDFRFPEPDGLQAFLVG
jgi:hypothetical protein